ncbi:Trihelix transcription factor GT-3a [Hibiscus syriacus]|uniref:Trihelix transcription factor GT-3a n=1 Tax=Hibiscus syriacus TaxID=106335 RepID=A0A6A2XPQ0_HIBSY|nr:Trihelix transcription factor GT-3a [Hibiscus syriacus]
MLGGGQWGQEETRELIFIRGELERDFTATKHNKTLWEVVSAKMKDGGFTRTPDQCKSKWKNLLNRYKGKETADPENGCQFPFFEELHALFTERAKNMQRRLLESEAGEDEDESEEESLLEEVVREFFNQQLRMEMQWGEMMERRARERQLFEQEWQQSMEKLERERLMVEKAWKEREEERGDGKRAELREGIPC